MLSDDEPALLNRQVPEPIHVRQDTPAVRLAAFDRLLLVLLVLIGGTILGVLLTLAGSQKQEVKITIPPVRLHLE
jgi:hypothetical protein